jgi:PhoH-like ATPase
MPLPPAPSKRAALLNSSAFDVPARSIAKPSRKANGDMPPTASTARAGMLARPSSQEARQSETTPIPEGRPTAPVAPVASLLTKTNDKPYRRKANGLAKLFVLDTNVLLHDPMCLFRFEEHDIFLPMIVLEELDGHKKGMTEVARNARQTSRWLDALAGCTRAQTSMPDCGSTARGTATLVASCSFQTKALDYALPTSLPQGKADNQILGVVEALGQQHKKGWQRQGRQRCQGRGAGVQGHQHACQGARAGPGDRRLPERQDTGKTATCCTPGTGLARRFLGHTRTDGRKLAIREFTPFTGSTARSSRTC